MAIIQISKIQQRTGNLVDLPQLDDGEFGFATDAKRLFIGKTTGDIENIEVLTAYAPISFAQIYGSYGNLEISANVANGEVLAYDGNAWVNKGGAAGGLITLGDVSNVKIDGGSSGYVLQTDGAGNLTWTAQTGGGGGGTPGGANKQIQFNDSSSFGGVTGFEYNKISGVLSYSGTLVTANIIPSANITYNLGNSSYRYKDLYLANSTIYLGSQTLSSNTTHLIFSGALSGNAAGLRSIPGSNVVGAVPLATVATSATTANTVTDSAQPNITSLGSLTSLTMAGNILPAIDQTYSIGAINYGFKELWLSNGDLTGNTTVINLGTQTITQTAGFDIIDFSGNVTVNDTLTTAKISAGADYFSPGTINGNWTLTSGSLLQATYSDLAEYYSADAQYEPATVLEFGGDQEVTLGTNKSTRVAGVVTTNPAYVMNATCLGKFPIAIALQGRVPCKVYGPVSKGDMMISAGNGYAKSSSAPKLGSVIGKSLENFDGSEGVIEIAVGRL